MVVGRVGEYTRAVVQDKSSNAPAGKALSFELDPVTGFSWLGECDANVDDVMSGKPSKSSQYDKAVRIILTALSDGGEVAASKLFKIATDEIVSIKTLKRAKSELGVVSYKRGDSWYWQLPIEAEVVESCTERQEGQPEEGHVQQPLLSLLDAG